MKKILVVLMMLFMITGCSDSQDKEVLFVKKDKKYAVCIDGELKSKYTYTDYEAVGTDGFIVSDGKKDSYINSEGDEKISYKKGVSLSAIGNMIIAESEDNNYTIEDADGKEIYNSSEEVEDEDKNYTIYDVDGKELYKSSKKVDIDVYGLPVIHKDKQYIVLDSNGETAIESKNKINYASMYNTSFITVGYKDSTKIYDISTDSQMDEDGLEIELTGQYELLDQDYKKGYLLYDKKAKNLSFVDIDGQIQFKVDKDIDSASINKETIIAKKDEDVYILSTKGDIDVKATSYYQNSEKYLVKNDDYVYGPHQFINNGKTTEVSGIQLNPEVNKVNGDIFPVYVQSKGYQYYDFSGKVKIKTYFKYAGDFSKDGVAVVSKDGEKYYLMDSSGKKLSKNYVKVEAIGHGYYAGYDTNTKFVVLDSNGDKVIDDYFMGNSEIFVFDDQKYGLFNKSGTTHVYNMNEYEEEFTLEGEYKVYQDYYLVSTDYKKYYDMNGEEYYKR